MTINALQLNSSTPWSGLGTATFNVVTAGLYTCAINCTIPYVASGTKDNSTTMATDPAASALSIVVNQNGSPVLTLATPPSPTQPQMGGSVRIQAAASDVITVVFSSAALADNQSNAVKAIINLFQGE